MSRWETRRGNLQPGRQLPLYVSHIVESARTDLDAHLAPLHLPRVRPVRLLSLYIRLPRCFSTSWSKANGVIYLRREQYVSHGGDIYSIRSTALQLFYSKKQAVRYILCGLLHARTLRCPAIVPFAPFARSWAPLRFSSEEPILGDFKAGIGRLLLRSKV